MAKGTQKKRIVGTEYTSEGGVPDSLYGEPTEFDEAGDEYGVLGGLVLRAPGEAQDDAVSVERDGGEIALVSPGSAGETLVHDGSKFVRGTLTVSSDPVITHLVGSNLTVPAGKTQLHRNTCLAAGIELAVEAGGELYVV